MQNAKLAYTVEEASKSTGIGKNTLRNLIEWKKIPVIKVGRKFLIKKDVLENFLSKNEGRDLRIRNDVEANNLKEQIKELEKKQAEENRRKRNHRLIEVGAAVESVLGKPIEKDDIPKLIGFLNKQEQNGKYFSTAMGVKETNVNSNK